MYRETEEYDKFALFVAPIVYFNIFTDANYDDTRGISALYNIGNYKNMRDLDR